MSRFPALGRALRAAAAGIVFFASSYGLPFAQTDRIMADVTWNGEAQGRTLVIVQNNEVLLSRRDLRRYGAAAGSAGCENVNDACFVRLSRLKDRLSYHFDRAALRLDVWTNVNLLPRRTVTVAAGPPPYQRGFIRGVVLNYGIHAAPQTPLAGFLEQRVNLAPNLVAENTVGRTLSGALARGLSSLTFDVPGNMRRIVLGDTTFRSGALGASAVIGGISIERAFSLDPYSATFPMPSMRAIITRPSQADIYVNGALVKSLDLPAGIYDLSDIPLQAGYSDARVVIRDEFGQRSTDFTGYGAPSLLRKGLTDYDYAVGFARKTNGFSGEGYALPLASAYYRIGVSRSTTVGGMVQVTSGMLASGLEYDRVVGLGLLEAGVSASDAGGSNGTAYAVGYGTTGLRTGASVSAHWHSATYRSVTGLPQAEPQMSDVMFSGTRSLDPQTTLSITARYARYQDAGVVRSATLNVFRRLAQWDIGVSATAGSRTGNFTIGLTRSFGAMQTQALRYDSGTHAAVATFTRGSDSPVGTSYMVNLDPAQTSPVTGNVHAGLPFALVNLDLAAGSVLPSVSSDVDGAVVFAAGRVLYGQPVQDGYAIVSSQGLGGADVTLNGHYAGRTDRDGYLLLPFLGSNQANSVGISDAALPLQDAIDGNDRATGPGYHAGSFVRFASHRTHAIFGEMRLRAKNGSTQIPAFGEIDFGMPAHEISSPIDETGRFYLDGVEPGQYRATILSSAGTCTMRVDVPAFSVPAYDMGTLQCAR